MLQSKPYNWKWSHPYFQEKTISKTKKQDQNNKLFSVQDYKK